MKIHVIKYNVKKYALKIVKSVKYNFEFRFFIRE